ncbi:lamin tail domain-containing protein [Streptomyces yunnanensis]|uniref:Lamin tail domain-containing protein n=1 Tax=Streptomyces yunnanensis TaxID=156453 RepID=A0ABY8A1W3_9ACTN|nr:lamin tail domain-containing protein [Streptomyces yunnanensis]
MPEVRAPRRRRRLAFLSAAVAGPTLVVGTVLAPPAHAAPADDIRINEVVTTGSVNDSIELYNKGTAAVNVSGWTSAACTRRRA